MLKNRAIEVCPRCHHYKWTEENCPCCDPIEAEVQDDLRAEEDYGRITLEDQNA